MIKYVKTRKGTGGPVTGNSEFYNTWDLGVKLNEMIDGFNKLEYILAKHLDKELAAQIIAEAFGQKEEKENEEEAQSFNAFL